MNEDFWPIFLLFNSIFGGATGICAIPLIFGVWTPVVGAAIAWAFANVVVVAVGWVLEL